VRFLKGHVRQVPLLLTLKFARFFTLLAEGPLWQRLLIYVLDLPLVPLGVIGVVLLVRRRAWEVGAPLAGLLSTLITVAIFWGDSRFRYVTVPFFAALAAVTLAAEWQAMRAGGSVAAERRT